jgi:universal stress protein E
MDKLICILVVTNRSVADGTLLAKAVLLARRAGARIHLFHCDSELAHVLRHAYDTRETEKAWQASVSDHRSYLEALRASMHAPDLDISIDAACDSPLYEAIIKKVLAIHPDLVMKSACGTHPLRRFSLDSNDWQLMRACPVTLMLVRGKIWAEPPRFAALVDVSVQETPHLAQTIVHTSEYFALGCRGDLDVVYSERDESGPERTERAAVLDRLAREYRIGAEHLHVLSGDPEVTLPGFAARQCYDALVLGALTHRKGIAALVGTLTGRLVDVLDCDFILVKGARGDRAISEAREPPPVEYPATAYQPLPDSDSYDPDSGDCIVSISGGGAERTPVRDSRVGS